LIEGPRMWSNVDMEKIIALAVVAAVVVFAAVYALSAWKGQRRWWPPERPKRPNQLVGGLRSHLNFGTFFAASTGAPRAVSPIWFKWSVVKKIRHSQNKI
jgi:hypothetical protein